MEVQQIIRSGSGKKRTGFDLLEELSLRGEKGKVSDNGHGLQGLVVGY